MKLLLAIVTGALWLVKRFLKKKDAHEPQSRIDEARDAAAVGDDDRLNADLDAARDRLRDPDRRS